ncbi:hypothetical protein N8310_05355 [Pseudomonadota bacterium]|nr:hypothetical protein [Pseudomonadota bacterium]
MRSLKKERSSFVPWTDQNHKYGHHFSFHLELQHITEVISKKMILNTQSFLGFNRKSMVNRMLQIIISSIYSDFSNFHLQQSLHTKSHYKLHKDIVNLPNYTIDLNEEKIILSNKLKFFLLIKLIKNFFKIQFYFLYKVIFSKYKQGHATIFTQNIDAFSFFKKDNDESFITFLNEFPINEFKKIDFLYIYCHIKNIQSKSKKVKYSFNPEFEVLVHLPRKIKYIFKFFISHWLNFFKIIFLIFKNPIFLLLQHDLIFSSLYDIYSNHKILKYIFYTNSNQFNIPLNFSDQLNKDWKAIMLWYSSGCDYISYDKAPLDLFKVRMQFIRFDKTYVWSHQQAKRLEEGMGKFNYSLCPPVTFYMPNEKLKLIDLPKNYVVIFDEIPHSISTIEKHYGFRYKYWEINTARKFIEDIIYSFLEINKKLVNPYTLVLKTKKKLVINHHDKSYQNIKNFAIKNGVLEANLDCNIFELINNSSLSIVAPFASSAHICSFMDKKCIYYDPKEEIKFIPKDHLKINLIKGQNELNQFLLKTLK